jgi:hypothetical protein
MFFSWLGLVDLLVSFWIGGFFSCLNCYFVFRVCFFVWIFGLFHWLIAIQRCKILPPGFKYFGSRISTTDERNEIIVLGI